MSTILKPFLIVDILFVSSPTTFQASPSTPLTSARVAFSSKRRARTMLALTYEELSLPALHNINQDPMRVERACWRSLRNHRAGCAAAVAGEHGWCGS
jgi:hypothetical protein